MHNNKKLDFLFQLSKREGSFVKKRSLAASSLILTFLRLCLSVKNHKNLTSVWCPDLVHMCSSLD